MRHIMIIDMSIYRRRILHIVVLLIPLSVACLVPSFSFITFASSSSNEPMVSLQEIIDQSSPGTSIVLESGTYQGPVIINKKLSIRGDGSVTLLNNTQQSAIAIHSNGVTLQGINIQHNADGESTAIEVTADEVTLEQLRIHTRGYGIKLREANRGIIQNNDIKWFIPKGAEAGKRGNGIDLYNSHDNQIEYNEISYLRDGIYLENSHNTVVNGNKLFHLRYGIHCMFIDGSHVTDNEGEYNMTGAMVMGVTNVVVSGNSFRKQSGNVHAQGILLYDVHRSSIERNVVEGNRVGIYMEQSSENQLMDNAVLRNFIGIQLKDAESNRIHSNAFIANVIEAEAVDSKDNEIKGNYWDSFQGLDLDHDGTSDIPYALNPFYQNLISRNSAYQLFFQSPGMTFLSDMFTGGREHWSADSSPLMKWNVTTPMETAQKDGTAMVTGWMLLFISIIIIIYMGVLRS
ncbi:right-handed parallel beta-helix repeat-containing protein [Paenibacillus sp. FA6]|uniref:right-handed parallel beta-helix repeat-containing protein n=1 Tax=Paenibacillus sp. FA6 TaxID=3413029 RepID=UPI003F65EAC7